MCSITKTLYRHKDTNLQPTETWTISAWYTHQDEQRHSGFGKQVMKEALAACLSGGQALPDSIDYIWNGANEYVLDWMVKHFDAVCTCPLAVQKKAPDDDWQSHIYHLDAKKLFCYFGLDQPATKSG